ncbi:MAG: DUF4189 domain-containing protein [Solirubrobacterales bacterium]|nr:DUF4189 domain-containing protein [Solirubrobacterales bacterium]
MAALVVPAVALAGYGAIAVNEHSGDHELGFASTRAGAERAAQQACGASCVILVSLQGACGAVVRVRHRYTAGLGATKQKAIRQARRRAHRPHGRVISWICVPRGGETDYGAIAVNKRTADHELGFSSTSAGAAQAAHQACGKGCVVIAVVHTGCVAVVRTGKRYTTGAGPTELAALQKARRRSHRRRAPVYSFICMS